MKFTVTQGKSKIDELYLCYGTNDALTEKAIVAKALAVAAKAIEKKTRGFRYYCEFVHLPHDEAERRPPEKAKTLIQFSHQSHIREFFKELEDAWYRALMEHGIELPDLERVGAWIQEQKAKPFIDPFLERQIHYAYALHGWHKTAVAV